MTTRSNWAPMDED